MSNLTPGETKELHRLIDQAVRDPDLGEFVRSKNIHQAVLLHDGKQIVGFAIPRKEGDDYWRTGPIYIEPSHRGKGVASKFIGEFFKGRKGRSYIDPKNTSSIGAFTKAGFSKTGKSLKDSDGVLLEEYKLERAIGSVSIQW